MLVNHDGIELDVQNFEGDTPLHKAVQYTDDPDVALHIGGCASRNGHFRADVEAAAAYNARNSDAGRLLS
jgi:hypothetical protein